MERQIRAVSVETLWSLFQLLSRGLLQILYRFHSTGTLEVLMQVYSPFQCFSTSAEESSRLQILLFRNSTRCQLERAHLPKRCRWVLRSIIFLVKCSRRNMASIHLTPVTKARSHHRHWRIQSTPTKSSFQQLRRLGIGMTLF